MRVSNVNYETDKITYTVPERQSTYTPDFRINTSNGGFYIEGKGRWTVDDRHKHLLIREQHPNLDIGSSLAMQTPNSTKGHQRPTHSGATSLGSAMPTRQSDRMVTGRKANKMTVPDTQANFVRHERCENVAVQMQMRGTMMVMRSVSVARRTRPTKKVKNPQAVRLQQPNFRQQVRPNKKRYSRERSKRYPLEG